MYDRVCQMNEKLFEMIITSDGSENSHSRKLNFTYTIETNMLKTDHKSPLILR